MRSAFLVKSKGSFVSEYAQKLTNVIFCLVITAKLLPITTFASFVNNSVLLMNRKGRKKRKSEKRTRQSIDKLEQSYESSRTVNALKATGIIVAGLYGCIIATWLLSGSPIDCQNFVETQATLGGWIVNMAAVASSFHGKCSSVSLVPGRTFFVSILALFMVNVIYIQSAYLLDGGKDCQYLGGIKQVMGAVPTIWIFQAIFILLIYILELQPSYTLKKEIIRH